MGGIGAEEDFDENRPDLDVPSLSTVLRWICGIVILINLAGPIIGFFSFLAYVIPGAAPTG
jgi:hypothetical protein